MFTFLSHSNGFRPSAVCRVRRQKLVLSFVPGKTERLRSSQSDDRRRGLGLGTPRNELLSNSHGDATASKLPMRAARSSGFEAVAAINSLSKRTGDR
jgi:hypothetical protein